MVLLIPSLYGLVFSYVMFVLAFSKKKKKNDADMV